MLELRGISKNYGSTPIIQKLDLSIRINESLALFGPNGCGKSTLLRILLGLDATYKGEIIDKQNMLARKSYLPQSHKDSLLPWLSARENIILPLKLKRIPSKIIETLLDELLESIDINFDLSSRAGSLSGGEAQSVCLLRALISKPKILFLDEPTSNLDYFAIEKFIQNINMIRDRYPMAIVSIFHDPQLAKRVSDRVIFLSQKPCRIVESSEILKGYENMANGFS